MYHNPDAKFQFMSDIIRWSISTVIMVINLILHYNDIKIEWVDFSCLLILIAQEFLIWIISRSFFRKFYKFPIDLELFQTRWGIWVMIVIGESVLQLLVHELNTHRLAHDYCFTLFSLTILFSLAMQYYDSCQRKWFEHAITKSAAAGMFWIWLHPIMTFFLFGIGAGLKMANATDYKDKYNISYQSNLLISTCMGLVTLCFSLMRFAHLNFTLQDSKQFIFFAIRAALSALQIFLVHVHELDSHGHGLEIIIAQMVISVFGFNLIDICFEVFFAEIYRQHGGTSKSWTQLELVAKDKEEKTTNSTTEAASNFRGRINSIAQWLPLPKFNDNQPSSDNKVYAMDSPTTDVDDDGPPAHHAKAIDC